MNTAHRVLVVDIPIKGVKSQEHNTVLQVPCLFQKEPFSDLNKNKKYLLVTNL
jgi:hypothetical protein